MRHGSNSQQGFLGICDAVQVANRLVYLRFQAGDLGFESLEPRVAGEEGGAEGGVVGGAEVQEELGELGGVGAGVMRFVRSW